MLPAYLGIALLVFLLLLELALQEARLSGEWVGPGQVAWWAVGAGYLALFWPVWGALLLVVIGTGRYANPGEGR